MNNIIINLSLVSDAAEYFDRQTSAAWRIRSTLVSMGVWAANSLLRSREQGNLESEVRDTIRLATLRTWLRDSNESSFVLDLTESSVRGAMGLDRQLDEHAEASRIARQKCQAQRSARLFTEHYRRAREALAEQTAQREARVLEISCLLSDTSFNLSAEVADYLESFTDVGATNGEVFDSSLYDDNSVEREADRLAETLGNLLESMLLECDRQLGSSIIANKVSRLTGYRQGIVAMMKVVGVDEKLLAQRQAKLEEAMRVAVAQIETEHASLDDAIAAQMAAINAAK